MAKDIGWALFLFAGLSLLCAVPAVVLALPLAANSLTEGLTTPTPGEAASAPRPAAASLAPFSHLSRAKEIAFSSTDRLAALRQEYAAVWRRHFLHWFAAFVLGGIGMALAAWCAGKLWPRALDRGLVDAATRLARWTWLLRLRRRTELLAPGEEVREAEPVVLSGEPEEAWRRFAWLLAFFIVATGLLSSVVTTTAFTVFDGTGVRHSLACLGALLAFTVGCRFLLGRSWLAFVLAAIWAMECFAIRQVSAPGAAPGVWEAAGLAFAAWAILEIVLVLRGEEICALVRTTSGWALFAAGRIGRVRRVAEVGLPRGMTVEPTALGRRVTLAPENAAPVSFLVPGRGAVDRIREMLRSGADGTGPEVETLPRRELHARRPVFAGFVCGAALLGIAPVSYDMASTVHYITFFAVHFLAVGGDPTSEGIAPMVQLQSGRFEEALLRSEIGAEVLPDEPCPTFFLAAAQAGLERYAEARTTLASVPLTVGGKIGRLCTRLHQMVEDDAAAADRILGERDPKSPVPEEAFREYRLAREWWSRGLGAGFGRLSAKRRTQIHLARALERHGDYAEARDLLARVESARDAKPKSWLFAGDDTDGAGPTAIPRDAAGRVKRGDRLRADGDLEGAIADYDEALILDPANSAAWVGRAYARQGSGDQDGALADLDAAIGLDPKNAGAWAGRGFSRAAKGDLDGALADYDRAVELAPDYVSARLNRGHARWRHGDRDGAFADIDEAVRLDPNASEPYRIRGAFRQGKADFAGAAADFAKALELAPSDWPHRNRVAEQLRSLQGK